MRIRKCFALITAVSLISSLFSGCGNNKPEIQDDVSTTTPTINVSVIEETTELSEQETAMLEEAKSNDSSIKSMVYSAVCSDLTSKGFETQSCVALSDDVSFELDGLGYYNSDFQLFDDDDYASLGFVTVLGQNEELVVLPEDSEYIAIEPINGEFNDKDAKYHIFTYSCEDISSGHFVFEDTYVIYYQQDDTTIRYEEFENIKENYDLSLGSLYDFDNDKFIYDADLFDGYNTHSASELFSEEDYVQLEKELQELSEQQEKNGYIVEEINVVYISPESIEAYLASEEEETFFGYSVSELEKSFGKGTALVYTENGFQDAKYYDTNLEDYNWKSFLTKMGVGCGIILVGAVLAPITGGASFGCALVTISKIAVEYALVQSLSTLTINVIQGMADGHTFKESIKASVFDGLDSFADGFIIGAAVGGIGVNSGLIKPTACFTAETMIAVPTVSGLSYKNIDEIKEGDYVYSYSQENDIVSINKVSDIIVNSSKQLVNLTINGEIISATPNHPFYNAKIDAWVTASSLERGDSIIQINGEQATVEKIELKDYSEDILVYNLTVENDHTYFVGYSSILVHNSCNNLERQRKSAIKKAWANEVKAVKEGSSKYNWTTKQLKELITNGKIKGYDGCHIVDVNVNPLLAGDPNNIIFLKRYSSFPGEISHFLVHNGNWNNPSNWAPVVKVMPQFKDMILAVGGIL